MSPVSKAFRLGIARPGVDAEWRRARIGDDQRPERTVGESQDGGGRILDAELVHAQRVLADRNSVANAGLRRYICRKSLAGPADKQQDETKVHNIAAVSTRVLQR